MLVRKFTTYKELKEMAAKRSLEDGKTTKHSLKSQKSRVLRRLRSWVGKYQRGEPLDENQGRKTGSQRGCPKTDFATVKEELAYGKAEHDYLKNLYRSRFGHEQRARNKAYTRLLFVSDIYSSPCRARRFSSYGARSISTLAIFSRMRSDSACKVW